MLDVKTPLSKLHRVARKVDPSSFSASPGLWAYLDSGEAKNITATSTQPKVLRLVLGNASSSQYESHDVESGRIATLEHVFRASVDTDGFQETVAAGTTSLGTSVYTEGAELTIAYTTSTDGTNALTCDSDDLGKLRPIIDNTSDNGMIVVARVESYDNTNGVLTFNTVTPYVKAGIS
jgi:hypothetical protein